MGCSRQPTTTTITDGRALATFGRSVDPSEPTAAAPFTPPQSAIRLPGLADVAAAAGCGGGKEAHHYHHHHYSSNGTLGKGAVVGGGGETRPPSTDADPGRSWDALATENGTDEVDYGQPCSISLLERLILTHPVWFLRGIYRAGAVHLLQGKETGNFIIRQSSQANTMAITVRLPEDKGPYIEHYLIEAIGNKLRLEGSDNHFAAIPMLVAHYCQCCDELPVQLTLPRSITEATTKQELSSIALLGQEFWGSSLASSSPQRTATRLQSPKPFKPLPIDSGRPQLTTFGSPTSPPPLMSTFKDRTPSTSSSSTSLSSFVPSPKDAQPSSPKRSAATSRPTPPPRWYSISPPVVSTSVGSTPPTSPDSSIGITAAAAANFTVTTTVTFHMNQCTAALPIQVETASCKVDASSNEGALPNTSAASADDDVPPQPTLTTATTATLTRRGGNRPQKKKEQGRPVPPPTLPCIESPPGYHCSSVADKVSDYEDIWVCSPSPIPNSSSNYNNGTDPPGPSSKEMEVVKALKALGLAGGHDSSSITTTTNGWQEYAANQTDQEKAMARHSQSMVGGGDDVVCVPAKQSERSKLALDLLPAISGFPNKTTDKEVPQSHSPFYSEPIDSLHHLAAQKQEKDGTAATTGPSAELQGGLPHHPLGRILEHRHSEPSILWCTNKPDDSDDVATASTSVDSSSLSSSGGSSSLHRSSAATMDWCRRREPRHQQPMSSSLTDLHVASQQQHSGKSGVVNIGFICHSSQLLPTGGGGDVTGAEQQLCGFAAAATEDESSSSETSGWATLPRFKPARKPPSSRAAHLLGRFSDFPVEAYSCSATTAVATTTTTTLRRHHQQHHLFHQGKSFNEMSWRLDSSWEWYSRNGGGSMPPSDVDTSSDDDEEEFVVENLDDDDDELGAVHVRPKGGNGPRFPMLRPPGTYVSNSFLNSSADTTGTNITIEQLLTQSEPHFRIPEIKPLTASNLLRVSEYDNLESDDDNDVAGGGGGDPCVSNAFADGNYRRSSEDAVVREPNGGARNTLSRFSRSVPMFRPPLSLGRDVGETPAVEVRAGRFAQAPLLSNRLSPPPPPQRKVPSEAGSSATEFSEPWDSSRWEQLLMQAATDNRMRGGTDAAAIVPPPPPLFDRRTVPCRNGDSSCCKPLSASDSTELIENDLNRTVEEVRKSLDRPSEEVLFATLNIDSDTQSTSTLQNDNDDYDEEVEGHKQMPVLPCLLSLRRKDRHLGRPIRDYVFKMAQDRKLIFGQHIENFIQCTMESHESDPHIVMRNIRQFMSGMANFLVNSGEGRFSNMVQEERAKLRPNEFLNLDTILEGVLHKIVVKPLKRHLCHLFVREYTSNGAVSMLCDSIKFARTRAPEQLGIKPDLRPLQGHCMETVKHYLTRLQRAYSPLKKLENLLAAISIIYQSILHDRGGHPQSVGADDFLPMLTYVLVHCGLIAAEIEAEYMWGLLHPSLLPGEGGYYLTTLSSAVHVLKHLQRCHAEGTPPDVVSGDRTRVALCLSELDGFMKVFVPDEQNGNIISKTVPVRPNMTTRDICRMVAHRLSVSNPQDYALYKLVNGEENMLCDTTCPWLVKMEMVSAGVDCIFAYKRTDAKIAWPVNFRKT